MKAGIHPDYVDTTITCAAAGRSFTPAPPSPTSGWRSAPSAIPSTRGSRSSWTRPVGGALPAEVQPAADGDAVGRRSRPRPATAGPLLSPTRSPRGGRRCAREALRPRCCLTSSARSKSGLSELARRLADPAIFSQQAEYARPAKEHADSQEIVERFERVRDVLNRITEARHILAEGGDRELRELAQAEIDELAGRQTELEDELKRAAPARATPTTTRTSSSRSARAPAATRPPCSPPTCPACTRSTPSASAGRSRSWTASATGVGGLKEVILFVQGRGAWSRLKFERGVHRVQRVPATESSGRIHTSTVTVAVLPEAEDVDVKVDEKDIRSTSIARPGPGGQGVNTTDSRGAHHPPARPAWS